MIGSGAARPAHQLGDHALRIVPKEGSDDGGTPWSVESQATGDSSHWRTDRPLERVYGGRPRRPPAPCTLRRTAKPIARRPPILPAKQAAPLERAEASDKAAEEWPQHRQAPQFVSIEHKQRHLRTADVRDDRELSAHRRGLDSKLQPLRRTRKRDRQLADGGGGRRREVPGSIFGPSGAERRHSYD